LSSAGTLAASDGYELRYSTWPAQTGARRATVVLFNGVMSHSGWFDPLALRLAEAGFHVVGADRRGSGMNQAARGDTPSAGQLVLDARRIIEAERGDPSRPLFLAGWCWGGVLAVNVALELGAAVAGLALLAPGLYPTKKLRDEMSAEVARRAGAPEDQACLESPIVEEMFTEGAFLESFIRRDPLRLKMFTPRFHQANVKLAMNAVMRLKTLKVPMLVVLASRDLATDNAETLRAFEKIPRDQVRIESLSSMHGMQFDQPELLARAISSWMGTQIAAAVRSST
jgi:alpha-beta hydrolase superfamily lysophospholipase